MDYYQGSSLINPPAVVIGVDPSSRKLAAVAGWVRPEALPVCALPQDKPQACVVAYDWVAALAGSQPPGCDVYVAVELPVLGRGGAGATIPQAQIGGALMAGIVSSGARAIMVNNSRAKKQIVGRGNADKAAIAGWVEHEWPDLYREYGADQDLCDATMIWQFGRNTVGIYQRRQTRMQQQRKQGEDQNG